MKDSFLSSLLLCLGTNESRRTAKFWHCSQGALSAPEIIYLFCLPNIPSASLPSLLRVLIAFLLTAAVKVQFFFKYFFQTLNCIFLLSKLTLSSAGTFFFSWSCRVPIVYPLGFAGNKPLCRYYCVNYISKYKKIALVLVYSFHYKSWRGHKEPSRKKGSSWWTSAI